MTRHDSIISQPFYRPWCCNAYLVSFCTNWLPNLARDIGSIRKFRISRFSGAGPGSTRSPRCQGQNERWWDRLIRCSIVMYCLPLDRTGYSRSQDVTCLQVSAATWYLLSLNVCVFIARAHWMRFALVVACTCIEPVVDICWFCACADLFWVSPLFLRHGFIAHSFGIDVARTINEVRWLCDFTSSFASTCRPNMYTLCFNIFSPLCFLFCTFCAVYLPGRVRSCWTSGSAVEQVTGAFERRQAETQNGQSMRTLAGAILAPEAHGDSKQQPEMHFAYFCLAKHIVQSVHVLTSSENWMWFWLHCCKVCEVAALGLDALWQRAWTLLPPWANFVA